MRGRANPFPVDVMSWEVSSINLFCQGEGFWPGACKQAIAAVVKSVIDLLLSFTQQYLLFNHVDVQLSDVSWRHVFWKWFSQSEVNWRSRVIFDQNVKIGVPSKSGVSGRIYFFQVFFEPFFGCCWKPMLYFSSIVNIHVCKHEMVFALDKFLLTTVILIIPQSVKLISVLV